MPTFNTIALSLLTLCREFYARFLFTSQITNSLWNQLLLFTFMQVNLSRSNFLFLAVMFPVSKKERIISLLSLPPLMLAILGGPKQTCFRRKKSVLAISYVTILLPVTARPCSPAQRLRLCLSYETFSQRKENESIRCPSVSALFSLSREFDHDFGTAPWGTNRAVHCSVCH